MAGPYDYLLLTAAVTRPDLHRRVFPGYLELIGSARVKWLINVDDVATGHSVAETERLIRSLVTAPNVDLEFLSGEGPGCFLEAAVRLTRRATALLDECRIGIVWLEDDWQRRPRGPVPDLLTALRLRWSKNRAGAPLQRCPGDLSRKGALLAGRCGGDGLWFVSLVPRSRVSFNPGIWSKPLFTHAMAPLERLAAHGIDDPETLCADPWNRPEDYGRLTVFVDPWFQDGGRHWSADRGVVKWEKSPESLQQSGSVSYTVRSTPLQLPAADVERLSGWLTIRRADRRALGWLVAKLGPGAGGLTAHLVGLRHPFAELRLVEAGQGELYLHRLHGWARTYPLKKLDARLSWRADDPAPARLEAPGFDAALDVSRHPPWRALWMVPIQALAGLLIYAAGLVGALRRLDAE